MENNLIRIFKGQGFRGNTFSNRCDKEVSPDSDKKGIFSRLSKTSKTAYFLTIAAAITFTGCATPFWTAAHHGKIERVEALLHEGTDVNSVDWNGYTGLMAASNGGHVDLVKMLLGKGADVNAKTEDGWTALDFAKGKGHQSIIKILLEADEAAFISH